MANRVINTGVDKELKIENLKSIIGIMVVIASPQGAAIQLQFLDCFGFAPSQ
jgi:hypothetical protein